MDKLWHFTPAGVDLDHRRFGIELETYLDYLSSKIEEWLFTPEAKVMAQAELVRAKLELRK